MKLEARTRLVASEEHVLDIKIQCSTKEAYKTIVNMLQAIEYNCGVGHSATIAGFFDGDGSDKITVEGLPEGSGRDMARAGCDYGDGLMLHIGPASAMAYADIGDKFTRATVWPPERASLTAVAGDPGVGATQSEQWFPATGEDEAAADSELLIDPSRSDLDVQEKMETPVALVNGADLETLLAPFENTDPEASQQTWEGASLSAGLDKDDAKLVRDLEKKYKDWTSLLDKLSASSDAGVAELAADMQAVVRPLTKSFKVMRQL